MTQPRLIGWRPIAHTSNQVVLYHTPSHALAVRTRTPLLLPSPDDTASRVGDDHAVVLNPSSSTELVETRGGETAGLVDTIHSTELCPYCYQTLPASYNQPHVAQEDSSTPAHERRHSYNNYKNDGDNTYPRRGRTRGSVSEDHSNGPVITPRFSALTEVTEGSSNPTRAGTPFGDVHGPSNEHVSSTTSVNGQDSESGHQRITPLADNSEAFSDTAGIESATVITRPYFRILERAHQELGVVEAGRGIAVPLIGPSEIDGAVTDHDIDVNMYERDLARKGKARARQRTMTGSRAAEGYYERFFIEEKKLGMGAEGTVYLCQHVLDSIPLGHYAIKKIAIGDSRAYLHKTLKEVRLLESLRHENIVGYHHVWIEETRFGSIGEPVAALHMLMMYANAGNLDAYISHRRSSSSLHLASTDTEPPTPASRDAGDLDTGSGPLPTAEQLKRAFKRRRASMKAGTEPGGVVGTGEQRGVMLLSREELGSLFGDIVAGLAFLHSNAILHLDLKCSNVLLHRRDDMSVPTAMISDFGTSQEMIQSRRERTGATGTMEYTAPESIFPDHLGRFREMDSKVDMWSLGLILHKLMFFRLPYERSDSFDELGRQISAYNGYKADATDKEQCRARGLPVELLTLLESLVNVRPDRRPTASKVEEKLRSIDLSAKQRDSVLVEALQLLPLSRMVLGNRADEEIISEVRPYDPVSNAGSVARIRRLQAVIALLKIVSVFPPIQTANPSHPVLVVVLILASLDLWVEDWVGWAGLMGAHLVILAWAAFTVVRP